VQKIILDVVSMEIKAMDMFNISKNSFFQTVKIEEWSY